MILESRKTSLGVTLIELMVALAIVGIIAAIAMPSFTELIQNHKARQQQWRWSALLREARAASVTSRRWVTVCPMRANQCVTDMHQPWVAFYDDNTNEQLDSGTEQAISTHQPNPESLFKIYNGRTKLPYFRYRATGASGYPRGFTVCPDGQLTARAFHLTSTMLGRIRFVDDTDGDGIVDRVYQGKRQNVVCS